MSEASDILDKSREPIWKGCVDEKCANHVQEILDEKADFQSQLTILQEKVKEVKVGDIDVPLFDDTNIVTGEEMRGLTLEMVYHMGAEMGILLCGEILSKPVDKK